MLYESSAEEIANQLVELKTLQINKLLTQNDQMLITWNRSQLFRKWPKCIIPGIQKNVGSNLYFTGMISTIKQKAYDYNSTLKPVEQQFNQQQKLKNQLYNSSIKDNNNQFKLQIQVGDNQENIQRKQEPQQNIQKDQKSQHASRIKSLKTQQIFAPQQKFSPFLPNYDNPFDRNANTKILKQKFDRIKLDSGKRNIAALVETQKKSKQTANSFKYGNSVPKKPTDSIDITDILKYTLGLKRQKQLGEKPEPIKNPFVRVPPKYYQSLGDFYNTKK